MSPHCLILYFIQPGTSRLARWPCWALCIILYRVSMLSSQLEVKDMSNLCLHSSFVWTCTESFRPRRGLPHSSRSTNIEIFSRYPQACARISGNCRAYEHISTVFKHWSADRYLKGYNGTLGCKTHSRALSMYTGRVVLCRFF
ncbi:hypothetical protein EDD36DRAFT_426123 [Exophiala viscosa]|uniref:Uncharacterized protein n=1 Tax=Exophiala viscosa TaxID=2486360 RepID=A0AAN6E7P6_9EURO|nr:hypothetical protein EDD36DRAFT_426123 [Exophiala viscosa]